uniref:CSC1/OSCA1-like cytosolic domain-containing protein n=1 Tax=Chaetoceros debilis TaxID=122233 RepID=A0A7S3QEB8_9STRA
MSETVDESTDSESNSSKRVMFMNETLRQRSLRTIGETTYKDEFDDMTLGRKTARALSSLSCTSNCYNPAERQKVDADEESSSSKNAPSLDKAWEYFEHQILPRRLVKDKTDSCLGKYDRAEVGEHIKKTKLYPVWSTPIDDMADFGVGVVLHFSTIRFLAILCFVAACINIPNMVFFASEEYGSKVRGNIESKSDWYLIGSALCLNTQWEACPTCTEEPWEGDTWQTFPRAEDRLATGLKDGMEVKFIKRNLCDMNGTSLMYGILTISSLVIVSIAFYYWIYSQKKRIRLYDDAEHSSADYTIEIKNPPKIESSLSPDVWKQWFETTFDELEVAGCTIALDNEKLVNAVAKRRSLILQLQNELENPEDFDIDNMESYVNQLEKVPKWKKILCFATSPDDIVKAIIKETEYVAELASKDYGVASVFLTFQTQGQQRMVLDELLVPTFFSSRKLNDEKYMYEGKILKVCEPAEPSDIRWGDLNIWTPIRVLQILVTTLVSLALIIGGGYIIKYARTVSPGFAGYAITTLNLITPTIVRMLTTIESHPNESSCLASKYLKITAFRWTNTALIYWVITPFTDTLADGKLVESIFSVFVLDVTLTPILQIFDIWGFLKRHCFAPRATHQRKMNLFFKSGTCDIGERSTNATRIMFFTLFYSAIFPGGFIFAFVIFSMMYWLDKFSVLRKWEQGPMIGTSVAKISNIFYLLALAAYAIMTFNNYAMFPFDNVCENGILIDDYIGEWSLTRMDGTYVEPVELTEDSSEYFFCNQNILRKFQFPPTPMNFLEDTSDWISARRETTANTLAWFMIVSVVIIAFTIGLHTIVKVFKHLFWMDYKMEKMTEEERTNLEKCRFCDLDEIKLYVPQTKIDGYMFPFLLCDVDEIDDQMIGWSDPDSDYDTHNIIFDIPQIAEKKSASRELSTDDAFVSDTNEEHFEVVDGIEVVDGNGAPIVDGNDAPIFSIIKSWNPVD